VAKGHPLAGELKERAVREVINRTDRDGVGVSQACREIGQELGVNRNTLRKLVAEYRRTSA
jgi:transposase-like protein